MNLYELTGSFLQIQQMIEDGQEGLEDTLESLNYAIEDKAVGYAKVMKNLDAKAKAIREEEKRLAERRKSLENNIARLKETLEETMIHSNKRKIETDLFTFNIQKHPPSLSIADEKYIPKGYFVEQDPKLNRKELLEDLKNGVEILGVEITQGESLRIR